MKITDGLLGEHALFYPLFDRAAALGLEAGSVEEVRLAMALIAPAIESHAELEDDLLFPALARAGIGEEPLRVMAAEHTEISAMIRATLRETDITEAKNSLLGILDLLAEHFRREEQIVFPLAGSLGDETLERLGAEWMRRRGLS